MLRNSLANRAAKINCIKRLICRCHALQRAKDLRDTVMSRLRRLNRLCSSTVSDTANMSRQGSTLCSPTVEKILCRSLFSQRSHVGNLRQTLQGKGRSSKRKENRRLSFLFAPAAGAATLPPPVRGEHAYAVRVPRSVGAEKEAARIGRTHLRSSASVNRCRETTAFLLTQ